MLNNLDQKDIEDLAKIAQEGKQQLIIDKLEQLVEQQVKIDIMEAKPRADSQMTGKDENAAANIEKGRAS